MSNANRNTFRLGKYVLFELPADYCVQPAEPDETKDDPELVAHITEGLYTDEEGEAKYRYNANVYLGDMDVDGEDRAANPGASDLEIMARRADNAKTYYMPDPIPAILVGVPMSLSIFGRTLRMFGSTLMVELPDGHVLRVIASNMIKDEDDEDMILLHLLTVAKSLTVNGHKLPVGNLYPRLMAQYLMDSSDTDVPEINVKMNVKVKYASSEDTDDDALKEDFTPAYPEEELYPHYNSLKNNLFSMMGATVNATGTEYEFIPLMDTASAEMEQELQSVVDADTTRFPAGEQALAMTTLFRVDESAFDTCHDRECELRENYMHRAYMMSALRSFAWTLTDYCQRNSVPIQNVDYDLAHAVVEFIADRDWLNYEGDSHCSGLCGGSDLHVYFLPDNTPEALKEKLLPDEQKRREVADLKARFPSYSEILTEVHSLDDLRRDLSYLYPAVRVLFDELESTRDRSEPLVGNDADIVYAWCAMTLAARGPFFTEDGPTSCFFTQFQDDDFDIDPYVSGAAEKKGKENRIRVFMETYGAYITRNPRVVFPGKLFVFSGFSGYEPIQNHPLIKKVLEKGGEFRSKASGLTNYVVVDPAECGATKIQRAIEEKAKRDTIDIILKSDLEFVLGMRKAPDGEEIPLVAPEKPSNRKPARQSAPQSARQSAPAEIIRIREVGAKREFCVENRWILEAPKTYEYELDGEQKNQLISGGIDLFGSQKPLILRTMKRPSGEYAFELVLQQHQHLMGAEFSMEDLRYDDRAETGSDGVVFHELIRDEADFVVDFLGKNVFPFGAKYEIRVRGENITPYDFNLTVLRDLTDDELARVKKAVKDVAKTIRPLGHDASAPGAKKPPKKKTAIEHPDFVIQGTAVVKYKANAAAVTVPEGITEIRENAFYGKSLKTISFPDSLRSIGDNAFASCQNLEAVVLPDSVEELGCRSFENCFSIEYVKLSSSLRHVGGYAFVDAHELSYLEIPEGVESIGGSAFSDCRSLAELVLPSTLKSLDAFAFKGCSQLTKVILPEGMETIGFTAFAWNDRMTYLYVPRSVTHIHDNFANQSPFEGCTALTIYGHTGSEIEKYAKSHGIRFSPVSAVPKATFTKKNPPAGCSVKKTVNHDEITSVLSELEAAVQHMNDALDEAEASMPPRINPYAKRPRYDIPEKDKYYATLQDCELTDGKLTRYIGPKPKPYLVLPEGIQSVAFGAMDARGLQGIIFSEGLQSLDAELTILRDQLKYVYFPSTFCLDDYGAILNIDWEDSEDVFACFDVSEYNPKVVSIDGVLYTVLDHGLELSAIPLTLEEITITKDVKGIHGNAFSTARSLKRILVENGHSLYESRNGTLCERKKGQLVLKRVPISLEGCFTCPDGVEILGVESFSECARLTEVVLSESVKTVEYCVFTQTPNLSILAVPGMKTELSPTSRVFFDGDQPWTIHCMEGSRADEVAKAQGWATDYSRYAEKLRLIRAEEERIRREAEEKRKAEEARAEAARLAEEARREEARRAEEERKEKERKAELEFKDCLLARQEEARRKKKARQAKIMKLTISITVILAILATAAFVLIQYVLLPGMTYRDAQKLFDQGAYEEAAPLYESLGDYKNSEMKLAAIDAMEALQNGRLDEAIRGLLERGITVTLSYKLNRDETLRASNMTLLNAADNTGETFTYRSPDEFTGMKTPTRKGHTFSRWQIDAFALDEAGIFSIEVSPVWDMDTYVISLDLAGGVGVSEYRYTAEDQTFTLENPTKTGYTFVGWTSSEMTTPVQTLTINRGSTGNHAYTANWVANSYTVSLNPDGGEVATTEISIHYDQALTLPTPVRKGYAFLGWYADQTPVTDGAYRYTENLALVAVWERQTYEIRLDLAGGTGTESYTYSVEDSTFILESPERQGYTFVGWLAEGSDTVLSSVTVPQGSTEDQAYVARWTANTYTIHLDANGGVSDTTEISVTFDSSYTLPVLTRKGYTFLGWMAGDTPVSDGTYTRTDDWSLTASWQANQYTITYEDVEIRPIQVTVYVDYQSANLENETLVLTSGDQLKKESLTKKYESGYLLRGWFTDAQCTNLYRFDTPITEDMTLYAGWQADANTYTGSLALEKQDSYYFWDDMSEYQSSSNTVEINAHTGTGDHRYLYLVAHETGTHSIYYKSQNQYTSIRFRFNNLTQNEFIGGDSWSSDTWGYEKKSFYCNAGDIIAVDIWYGSSSNAYVDFYFEGFAGIAENAAPVEIPEGDELAYNQTAQHEVAVTYGSEYTLPVPVRKGYTFTGWYCDGQPIETEDGRWSLDEDVTLTAGWEPQS